MVPEVCGTAGEWYSGTAGVWLAKHYQTNRSRDYIRRWCSVGDPIVNPLHASLLLLTLHSVCAYLLLLTLFYSSLSSTPHSLLLLTLDVLKISDFGLSTVFRHMGKERKLSRRCGTPPYIAPEVCVAVLCINSVKGGAHTCFIDVWISNNMSTKHIWAPPLTEVQWYNALNTAICDRNMQQTGIIFDFYMGRPHIVLWGDWAWMNPMLAYLIACLLLVAMHTVI